jgi:hypothetical protein
VVQQQYQFQEKAVQLGQPGLGLAGTPEQQLVMLLGL